VFSSEVSRGDIAYLKEAIEEFHETYHEIYPEVRLKPKCHYTLHYAIQIERFGPMINCWTLRFEGKHQYFKELVHRTKNRINLCKTLAERHLYYQALLIAKDNVLKHTPQAYGVYYPQSHYAMMIWKIF